MIGISSRRRCSRCSNFGASRSAIPGNRRPPAREHGLRPSTGAKPSLGTVYGRQRAQNRVWAPFTAVNGLKTVFRVPLEWFDGLKTEFGHGLRPSTGSKPSLGTVYGCQRAQNSLSGASRMV
jgi:hypothetical protein